MIKNGLYAVYEISTGFVIAFHNERLENIGDGLKKVPYVTENISSSIQISGKELSDYTGLESDYRVVGGALQQRTNTQKTDTLKKKLLFENEGVFVKDIDWTDLEYLKYQKKVATKTNNIDDDKIYNESMTYYKEGKEEWDKVKNLILSASSKEEVEKISSYKPNHANIREEITGE